MLHVAVGGGAGDRRRRIAAGDSLQTIASKITGATNSDVYASVVNNKLVLSGKTTGAANTISVTSDSDLAASLGWPSRWRRATPSTRSTASPSRRSASNTVTSARCPA